LKIPKELTTYCKKCNAHTAHTVTIYKKGKPRALAKGALHHEYDKKGYGGQKFPELKRTAKTTKKITLKLTCKTCGFISHREGVRLSKAIT